jgi:hypothetical protein
MVRAIIEGSKTQTRRVIVSDRSRPRCSANPASGRLVYHDGAAWDASALQEFQGGNSLMKAISKCPYGIPGSRLWVREKFRIGQGQKILYHDSQSRWAEGMRWKSSIHMPRSASRLTLEITAVRVERLHAISEDDAQAEGISERTRLPGHEPMYAMTFAKLWDEINAKRGHPWSSNPWVWIIQFQKVEK